MVQNVTVVNNEVQVSLSGKIYVEEAATLRQNLIDYIEKGHKDFVINMAQVDYIDSSGLGVLVAIQKRALQNGGGVVIKDLQGIVKELFELTRLTKVFTVI
ncbi:MAG: STAS domain-containing protein [Sporomusaceae bacterium]|nr:STAS domain-containing protein [Sporomusaceae bacterium]